MVRIIYRYLTSANKLIHIKLEGSWSKSKATKSFVALKCSRSFFAAPFLFLCVCVGGGRSVLNVLTTTSPRLSEHRSYHKLQTETFCQTNMTMEVKYC